MKKLKFWQVLEFAAIILFITNLWIWLYNNLLKYLNNRFPAKIDTSKLIGCCAAPEPYEIPLYYFLTAGFIIIILLVYRFKKTSEIVLSKKWHVSLINIKKIFFLALFAFMILIFYKNLGSYPMHRDTLELIVTRENPVVQTIFFVVLASIIFIISEIAILQKILPFSIRNKKIITYFFAVFFISVVVFEPGFPMSGHDYSPFFSPIKQVLDGRTIYTDTPSQYGFLAVLFVASLVKIGLLNIWYLPALVWFLYVVQYFLIFYLLYKITKSLPFAFIGLFSVLIVNYMSLMQLPATYPQIGPMRWLPIILSIFILYRSKNILSPTFLLLGGVLSLWFIDTGIAIFLSVFSCISFLFLSGKIKLRQLIQGLFIYVGTIIFTILLLNIIHLLIGLKLINLFELFMPIKHYAIVGFGMIAIPAKTYFWIVIFNLFLSIFYLLRIKSYQKQDYVLLFIAFASFFSAVYYVGRSHPHNLFIISIMPITTVFIFVGNYYKLLNSVRIKLLAAGLILLILICIPYYARQEAVASNILRKAESYMIGSIFTSKPKKIVEYLYDKDLKMVENGIVENEVFILTYDDAYLFYLLDKKNIMKAGLAAVGGTWERIDYYLKPIYNSCPKVIAADCGLMKKCQKTTPFGLQYVGDLSIYLRQIENKCNVKYIPFECGNQLCLARGEKNDKF